MPRPKMIMFAALAAATLSAAPLRPALADPAGPPATEHGDGPRSFKDLSAAARKGEIQACFDLGLAYRDGKGTARDPGQAYKWFRMAADKDMPEGQFEVAQLLEEGEGVDKNLAEAAEWYRKAAQQGHVLSMFALGEMYRSGDGVPKDEAQAARWYRPAAEKGDIDSALALGKLFQQGLGVPKSPTDAANWYRKAGQFGSAEGRYLLALLLLNGDPDATVGRMPSRTSVEGMQCLEAAADQGYAPAQYYLGVAHLGGIEAPLDLRAAVRWLQTAADQGYAPALHRLGRLYAQGKGLPQDAVRAYVNLELADQLGDETARGERDDAGRALSPAAMQAAKRRVQDWLAVRGN